ncbi:MAG: AAA family ATPase, partial [Chloroflexota bacterium]
LTAGLDRAGNGRGSAWLIGGESGVGKSRLLRELQTVGLVNGLQLLTGQAEDDAANGAYQIWREPLRQMIVTLSDLDDLAASTLLPLVPDIARLLNRSVEPATNLTRGATQIRLFSIVTNLFRQIERPILLILEDLHWETESLSLLTHLISQIETLPLMVVGSFRNDERPNLVDLLSGMQLINLERLSERNMAQLSASMLGEIGQKPEIVAYLQHETEGNAFFAVEIVRALAEEAGRLDLINQTLLPEKLLPSGILQVVERLFNKIPEEARPLLRLAAVAGRQIDIDLLMLADQSGQDVEGVWLQTCADRGIFEIQDGRWRFRHDKLREWLLDTLSESDCQQFHQHIAFSLETLYGEGPIYAGRLAYHWSEAGEFEKEEAYAILAGDYAKEQYLIDEAQLFYQRALELIGNPTTPGAQIKKIDLLNKLADVLTNSAPAKAYQLAEEARTLTTTGHLAQQPYGAGLAQSINRMGSASGFQGQHSKAFVHYEEAAPLLKASGDLTNYAHTLFSISSAYYNRGFIDEAEAYILQAKAIGEELEDKAILARAYMGLSIMNSTANRLDGVTAYMDTALVLMREIGDRRSEAMMLLNAAVTLNKLSRLEEAVEKALAGLAIAEEINDFQIAIRVSCNIVNYYTNLKAYDTAWEYVRRSLDRLEGKEIWELEVLVYSSLFELSNRQQKFEEARQYAEPALRAVQKIDQPRYTSQLLKGLIDIYAALGENDKAAKLEEMLSEPI